MSISHKHKFIFIKTVKAAGTSLEVFLSQHCGPDDILTLFDPPIEGHQPRNYNGSGDHVSEILRIPFGPRSAWRCLLARRERFYNHMLAWLVRLRIPPTVWNSYFKFCVERNPWDKVLSHYHMHAYRLGGALSSSNTSPEPSSRSITRVTPIHPDQELSSIELFAMKI